MEKEVGEESLRSRRSETGPRGSTVDRYGVKPGYGSRREKDGTQRDWDGGSRRYP